LQLRRVTEQMEGQRLRFSEEAHPP
jgi:hypothetical protein